MCFENFPHAPEFLRNRWERLQLLPAELALPGLPQLRTSCLLLYIGADGMTYSLFVVARYAHGMILEPLVLCISHLYTSRNNDGAWY